MGYLFIGLAVITLLGANWDDIPRAVRMWGLIILTVTTHGFALRKYQLDDRSGASIILIAQIYHLGEHKPDGVFWWALGCLPIGLLINNPWVTLQTVLLGLLWFLMEVGVEFYPAMFPVFILGSLIVLYREKESIMLLQRPSSVLVYFQIVFNLVLISVGVWLIIRGIHEGISHYFFLGIVIILLTALMRHVDLIGDYIGHAVLFMVFAMLLLGAAKYWKSYQAKEGRA